MNGRENSSEHDATFGALLSTHMYSTTIKYEAFEKAARLTESSHNGCIIVVFLGMFLTIPIVIAVLAFQPKHQRPGTPQFPDLGGPNIGGIIAIGFIVVVLVIGACVFCNYAGVSHVHTLTPRGLTYERLRFRGNDRKQDVPLPEVSHFASDLVVEHHSGSNGRLKMCVYAHFHESVDFGNRESCLNVFSTYDRKKALLVSLKSSNDMNQLAQEMNDVLERLRATREVEEGQAV